MNLKLYSPIETIKKGKEHIIKLGKIFVAHITDKWIVSWIQKGFLQIDKQNQPSREQAEEALFTKEEISVGQLA